MLIEYLHRDDVPETLALLKVLLGDRQTARPGYAPHESDADIDWEILADSDRPRQCKFCRCQLVSSATPQPTP
jgi:hypothetical protein